VATFRPRSHMDRFAHIRHPVILGGVVVGAAVALFAGFPVLSVAVAAVTAWVILRLGVMMLGGLARPVPEPPPPGELRKVKLVYRCDICGAEVRMTVSPTDDPEPPRHCQDDMRLMTPVDDL
jgi:hypothetical protein